ncbi:MAG: YhgE/Pip domain-containing protein, partial [Lachnospiraceae bacterium]
MLKNEWKKLFQSKFMVVVMIAVMLIPTIYTAIFVGSMWDPYGNTENLPVAVVNKDKAVTYNEKELNVGEDLVENLEENNSLGFHFVDEDEAAEGLAKGDYYMVITIPEDFSKNVTTLTEDKTKKMQLYYETNPGQNYIASKMSETAIKEIQANIREKITTQYTETMFEQLGTIGDGFVEAADGALQITDGTDQLLDGNQQIGDGLNTLAEGTLTLKKGGAELQAGLDTYTKGVGTLEQGAATLDSKSNELNQGVESVSEGITSLKGGSGAILAGMKTMSGELSKSLSKENMKTMEQLENGLTAMNDGIQQLNTAVQGMNVGSQLTETV